MRLKSILETVGRRRSADFLTNDPLEFPRAFPSPGDREVAAFLSASLAYGRVGIIRRNLADLFSRMPEGPEAFVRHFEPRRDAGRFAGFKHRFNSAEDVACLCWILRQMLEDSGSLEAFFLAGDVPEGTDIGPALSAFSRRAMELDVSAVFRRKTPPPGSYLSYFFPSPEKGSACKRLCMLLRWLCRPEDGIDLGLWTGISPARLVIPLDTHTARISRLVGLTRRTSPGWAMAQEVTEGLRRFDPDDPVRYDFALSHLGISEGCRGKKGVWCVDCAVEGECSVSAGSGDGKPGSGEDLSPP